MRKPLRMKKRSIPKKIASELPTQSRSRRIDCSSAKIDVTWNWTTLMIAKTRSP